MSKKRISLLLNTIIVILEIISLIVVLNVNKQISFEYYTSDSNILCMFTSLIFIIYLLSNKKIPRILSLLKYTTTICLSLTFFVVIFILAPMYNFNYSYLLFENSLLYHHLLCPILSIITFIFFDDLGKFTLKDNFIGILLTLFYAVLLTILNIFRVIEGPYPFLMVYKQTIFMCIIWFIVILTLAYILAYILRILYIKFNK